MGTSRASMVTVMALAAPMASDGLARSCQRPVPPGTYTLEIRGGRLPEPEVT
ncbi:MAG: hypothetical protein HY815_07215 [Candidatus Riflebacteria bacterium]|nr:hypothetical protein [Candidatus Riflebacteria bacterium]